MKYLSFLVVSVFFYGFGFVSAAAQVSELDSPVKSSSGEPLKVIKVSYPTGRSKTIAGKFWLDDLRIEVENISAKTIDFAEMKISFSGGQAPRLSAPINLQYGGLKDVTPDAARTAVKPGEKFVLSVVKSSCDEATRHSLFKSGYIPAESEINVRFGKVIFNDETAWANKQWFTRDSANPRRFIPDNANINIRLFAGNESFSILPAALKTTTTTASCGTYAGYEVLYCCGDLYVFSDLVDYEQPGGATLRENTANCPGGGSCTYNQVIPCR